MIVWHTVRYSELQFILDFLRLDLRYHLNLLHNEILIR